MNRLASIIREDNDLLKGKDGDYVIAHKLAQISATLAMILDAIEKDEASDDGR